MGNSNSYTLLYGEMVLQRVLTLVKEWRAARQLEQRAPEAIRAATLRLIAQHKQDKLTMQTKIKEVNRRALEHVGAADERIEQKFQEMKRKFEGDVSGAWQDLQLQHQDQLNKMLPHMMANMKESQMHRLAGEMERLACPMKWQGLHAPGK